MSSFQPRSFLTHLDIFKNLLDTSQQSFLPIGLLSCLDIQCFLLFLLNFFSLLNGKLQGIINMQFNGKRIKLASSKSEQSKPYINHPTSVWGARTSSECHTDTAHIKSQKLCHVWPVRITARSLFPTKNQAHRKNALLTSPIL